MDNLKENLIQIITDHDLIVDKYLNLNQFSALLFDSLEVDGCLIQNLSIIYNFFIETIHSDNEDHLGEELILLVDTPREVCNEQPSIYPNNKTTFIHVSILTKYYHLLIQKIGYQILEIDPDSNETNQLYYAYWLTNNFNMTFELLNKFSKEIISHVQEADKTKQFSHTIQAMAYASTNTSNIGEIRNIIKHKEGVTIYADQQIDRAIVSEFYLEAIALQESRLSDRLALFLSFKKIKSKNKSFSYLINAIKKHCQPSLICELNDWREARNRFMHQMVRSSIEDELINSSELKVESKKSALKGSGLVKKIDEWFENQVYMIFNPMTLVYAEDVEQIEKVKIYLSSTSLH
jgi:hypothetical protein